ncbi:hypothetical protein KY331_03890 [Candidatus Woesearchaeota archaeon]|nr:hypothetical protein [Candidatus Woesearchaeota archaeon]
MTNFLSFALVAGLHKLFALAFLLGLIFFVVWALRNLKKNQLKKLSITLLVIGIVGCLLITALGGFGLKTKRGLDKFHPGIWKCMEDDGCRGEMDRMMELRGFK